MTADQLAQVLDAGFNATRGHDDRLAAALYAMANKAREIAHPPTAPNWGPHWWWRYQGRTVTKASDT